MGQVADRTDGPNSWADEAQRILEDWRLAADAPAVDRAVKLLQRTLDAVPDGHPALAPVLSNLGVALRFRFERSGQVADLEEAVHVGRQAIAVTSVSDPTDLLLPRMLINLCATLHVRYGLTGDVVDADEAIRVGERAVAAIAATDPLAALAMSNLAAALLGRFWRTRHPADLDRVEHLALQAVAAAPEGHPDLAGWLSILGVALDLRYDRTGRLADLEKVIQVRRRAVAATPGGHPRLARHRCDLGMALLARYERTERLADLDESVYVQRQALAAAAAPEPELIVRLSNLGVALRRRFDRTGQLDDLNEAVQVLQQAIAGVPESHSDWGAMLGNLGLTLRARFESTGRLDDLAEAVRAGRAAIAAMPQEHPGQAGMLVNLGLTLRAWSEHTGQLDDLNEAVRVLRQGIAGVPEHHPDWGGMLAGLGGALLSRFSLMGQLDDLNEAVRVGRQAVAAIPQGHPGRAGTLSTLGVTLRTRFERSGQPSDLDEAVQVSGRAVAIIPADHPHRVAFLTNVGTVLKTRFDHTGRLDDLDEAVRVGQEAVAYAPAGHPGRAGALSNLGIALATRYDRTGELANLDEAVLVGRQAIVATADGHPDLPMYLGNLAGALYSRYLGTGRPADLDEAVRAVRRGSSVTAGSAANRAKCSRVWTAWTAGAGDWAESQQAIAAFMSLLPQLADRGLGVDDRRSQLAALSGWGPGAAWAIVRGGRATDLETARQAWSVLEASRGVLLGQALETRDDLTALSRNHPHLADQVVQLRGVLNQDPPSGAALMTPDTDALRRGADRVAAAEQWTRLMQHVRSLPGLDRFGLPPTIAQMHAAAGDGSIVAVLAADIGCGALIMNNSTAQFLPLPHLTEAEATRQAHRYLRAVYPTAVRDLNPADAQAGNTAQELRQVLGWLWDTVCEPILEHLGHSTTVTSDRWPRVWWIPTRVLSLLPLHAAGHHHRPGQAVLDRVISSYTPTVRMLWHARQRDIPAPATHALIAGINTVGYAAGLPTLAHAEAEARLVHRYLKPHTPALLGHDASHHAIMQALQHAGWAHFACHGFADQTVPADSHLALHDRPLPVRDIAALDLTGAYLAVLSACTTAVTAPTSVDESIHLASAFQLGGFAHTIATLWPISDIHAPQLAEHLYHQLTSRTPPADALHHTTRWARAHPDLQHPQVWASHIHLGP